MMARSVSNILLLVCLVADCCMSAVIITAGPEPTGGHIESLDDSDLTVQNMIRNSGHKTWCRTGNIRQIITHANCHSLEVENKVCAGSCFSYSVPQTQPQTPGDAALDFCDSCQPAHSHWVNVTLTCSADDGDYEVIKKVQQIVNCTCSSCPGSTVSSLQDADGRISELLASALPPQADPELNAADEESAGEEEGGEDNEGSTGPSNSHSPLSVLTSQHAEVINDAALDKLSAVSGVAVEELVQAVARNPPMSNTVGAESSPNAEHIAASDDDSSDTPVSDDLSSIHDEDDDYEAEVIHYGGPSMLRGSGNNEDELIFNPEGENGFNEISSGLFDDPGNSKLSALMNNLNDIMQGNSQVDYQGLSIKELKSAIEELNSSGNDANDEEHAEAEPNKESETVNDAQQL